MLMLYTLAAVAGGLLTLHGLWQILDLSGRRDVFVVRPVESLGAHSRQLHIGGVAAEAETTAGVLDRLVVTGELPTDGAASRVSWNAVSLTVCTFGLGGLLGWTCSLSSSWQLGLASFGAIVGAASGYALHLLRRKWD